jgi:hypothetical protein
MFVGSGVADEDNNHGSVLLACQQQQPSHSAKKAAQFLLQVLTSMIAITPLPLLKVRVLTPVMAGHWIDLLFSCIFVFYHYYINSNSKASLQPAWTLAVQANHLASTMASATASENMLH